MENIGRIDTNMLLEPHSEEEHDGQPAAARPRLPLRATMGYENARDFEEILKDEELDPSIRNRFAKIIAELSKDISGITSKKAKLAKIDED